MLTNNDMNRILESDKNKKIDNAIKACKNSQTEWAKNYWFNVWKTLCQKYNKQDLYKKNLN
jgi:hypothetical protein